MLRGSSTSHLHGHLAYLALELKVYDKNDRAGDDAGVQPCDEALGVG